jgi:hypothetical protein
MKSKEMPRSTAIPPEPPQEEALAQNGFRTGEPTSAAKRALAEAAERRRNFAKQSPPPPEISGRGGPDPARYGDWEVNGIASDF